MTRQDLINNYKNDRGIKDSYKLNDDENYLIDKLYEAINYTHCCTTFTCDVCYKETSNKKDNEGYRYCKSCKEL